MKSIYNEERYLKEKNLTYFEDQKKSLEEKWERERKTPGYQECIERYHQYIIDIVELLEQIKLKTPLEKAILISFLIEEGYCSMNQKYIKKEPEEELSSKYGLSIIEGTGCCRNVTDFTSDILTNAGEDTRKLYCREGLLRNPNMPANHVINLIKHQDIWYGIDTYNKSLLYQFKRKGILESISLYTEQKLRNKPYYEWIEEQKELAEIEKEQKEYEESQQKRILSALEYHNEIKYECKKRWNETKNIWIQFAKTKEQEKQEIAKQYQKLKRQVYNGKN